MNMLPTVVTSRKLFCVYGLIMKVCNNLLNLRTACRLVIETVFVLEQECKFESTLVGFKSEILQLAELLNLEPVNTNEQRILSGKRFTSLLGKQMTIVNFFQFFNVFCCSYNTECQSSNKMRTIVCQNLIYAVSVFRCIV